MISHGSHDIDTLVRTLNFRTRNMHGVIYKLLAIRFSSVIFYVCVFVYVCVIIKIFFVVIKRFFRQIRSFSLRSRCCCNEEEPEKAVVTPNPFCLTNPNK